MPATTAMYKEMGPHTMIQTTLRSLPTKAFKPAKTNVRKCKAQLASLKAQVASLEKKLNNLNDTAQEHSGISSIHTCGYDAPKLR